MSTGARLEELLAACLEELRALRAARPPGRRRPDTRVALPVREVERRLGIDRPELYAHLRAGHIKLIPWGVDRAGRQRRRVPAEEVARIEREGLPPLPERVPELRPSRQRKTREAASVAEGIRELEV